MGIWDIYTTLCPWPCPAGLVKLEAAEASAVIAPAEAGSAPVPCGGEKNGGLEGKNSFPKYDIIPYKPKKKKNRLLLDLYLHFALGSVYWKELTRLNSS